MAIATYKDLCIDAVDARRMAAFWAPLLQLEIEELEDGDVRLTGPTPAHTVWVNTVREPVTVKQRVHLDVRAPSVDDVVALAGPILRHRMAVNFSARAEGVTVESVIAQMCARLG